MRLPFLESVDRDALCLVFVVEILSGPRKLQTHCSLLLIFLYKFLFKLQCMIIPKKIKARE